MEGQTEDGGDLVSLHLGANKILSSNMLKWGLNLTFLLWSSTVLRIFLWLHWTDQGLQNNPHHFVWHCSFYHNKLILGIGYTHYTDGETKGQRRATTCIIGPEPWVSHLEVAPSTPARALKWYLQKGGCSWACILYSDYMDVWKQVSFPELRADIVCRVDSAPGQKLPH